MMIDTSRLENGLMHVARRYAPALIPTGWQQAGDYTGALPDLARALAASNVLVMVGDAAQASVKAWTDGYLDFYRALCAALFPSFGRATAFYVDQEQPMIVAMYGEATPVIRAMAGFVAPYVVARQGTRPLEVEVVGMMDMILEELEATDLPRDAYRQLRDRGVALLRQLLDINVQQLPLTPAARPIFDDMAAQRPEAQLQTVVPARSAPPPQPVDLPEPPAPPETMPEEIQAPPPAPAPAEPPKRTFDPDAVPIFFNPGANPQRGSSVPPVPPLPPRK